MSDPTPQIPLSLSEADFQRIVVDYAQLMRWHWCHYFPLANKRGRYQTPVSGHPGCPDIILAKNGRVLLVELKTSGGRLRPGQMGWLAEAGEHGRVWRPSDWNSGEIVRTLRHYWREPVAR